MEVYNNKRKALGRGLEELFNSEVLDYNNFEEKVYEKTSKEEVIQINLDELRSNPYQPRKTFDEKSLEELAQSIKENGIIQPIIVKKSIKGYEIIAGERRVKASKIAGLDKIPAIIRNLTDEEMMQIALLENLQRENLNIIEEANAYKNLLISLEITQEELAKKLGKSRSHITNVLGILELPKIVKDMIIESKISMGHARVLSKLEDEEKIIYLTEKIIKDEISVRELENLAKEESYTRKKKQKVKINNNEYKYLEKELEEKLNTKIKVSNKKIEIYFSSNEDLNRILEIMQLINRG